MTGLRTTPPAPEDAIRPEALREAAQELMNASEGYDPNVKQAIRAADALRGAADEIDRLNAVLNARRESAPTDVEFYGR